MSNRSAARGTAAASSIRLTLRTSNAVATSNASPSRCFLFCDGSRAARSARTAAATVSTKPIPKAPPNQRRRPPIIRSPAEGVGRDSRRLGAEDRLKGHESRRRTMAHGADHLSVSALEQQYRSCTDVTAARHLQTIWLLAKGHEIAEVAATVSYAQRWVERLLARYNAQGPQALGDLRRRNGTSPSVLRPDLLEKLKARLLEPPPDGGLWTSPKVAAWMAGELGLAAVLPQRGWEALKAINWSVQKPRPRHPAAATPEECETFKKSWPRSLPSAYFGSNRL